MNKKNNSVPFYCGSQYQDWKSYNCDECAKGYDEKKMDWICKYEKAIDSGYMADGSCTEETAKAIGVSEDGRVYNWRCPLFKNKV